MTLSKRLKHEKNNKICSYSGELIANKKVILEKYAIEYVKKLGYYVTPFKVK